MAAPEAIAPSIGEALLAAYRGDPESASVAMASVGEWGNPMARAWVHRVRSVVLTQGGDPGAGFDAAMAAIAEQPSGPNSMLALWAAGRAALWATEQLPLATERIQLALEATTVLETPGSMASGRASRPPWRDSRGAARRRSTASKAH